MYLICIHLFSTTGWVKYLIDVRLFIGVFETFELKTPYGESIVRIHSHILTCPDLNIVKSQFAQNILHMKLVYLKCYWHHFLPINILVLFENYLKRTTQRYKIYLNWTTHSNFIALFTWNCYIIVRSHYERRLVKKVFSQK